MAQYSIPKLNQISKKLELGKKKLLADIERDGKEQMREYVRMYWYSQYSPSSYNRTMEVLDSVSAKLEGDSVVIYYDNAKIGSAPNSHGWGAHASFDGSSFSNGIVAMIEDGMSGGSPSNPRIGAGGAHAIPKLIAWLATYIARAVQSAFGAGVTVG